MKHKKSTNQVKWRRNNIYPSDCLHLNCVSVFFPLVPIEKLITSSGCSDSKCFFSSTVFLWQLWLMVVPCDQALAMYKSGLTLIKKKKRLYRGNSVWHLHFIAVRNRDGRDALASTPHTLLFVCLACDYGFTLNLFGLIKK